MIGLDTNVLVRYFVNDEPQGQSRTAAHVIEEQCTANAPGWINRIVLCELVWVLETAYDYPRETIAQLLTQLLAVSVLSIENPDAVRQSVNAYQTGDDFADTLIGLTNGAAGCRTTVTFDKRAARSSPFTGL